ncbi:type 1 glutamine amidotransferase [Legionella israelensis]|uniref:Glutamine amidotransferase n=1 Tax=Legionella israelensis TaxID=454 RepID=A0A0W0VU56_9GAMM|nr:type 1 glutamine amidotransferase [Legionella israelensis]KTD23675.1 glutamine amidotransferase [Legionella israelensis]QBS10942.1 glutamine amidotransferase [Legionella israelensis]SCX79546.1 GMP synthase-Glutamine amidotransferase [Legionella israelensis DSM 19235]STX57933.1 glutamine amidotransferase [Legionella israelensis]
MARIVILQHSPYEPLGIIINTLKQKKMRLKYVNFHRNPDHSVNLQGYDGLIILGGNMNPDELEHYPHLTFEIKLIHQAIEKNIPVLGICLGSQLLNLALGGECYCLAKSEFGWSNIYKKSNHPLFTSFPECTKVFQWHRYASRVPNHTDVVLENEQCVQAFSYQKKHIGLQFHLEVDKYLISRWMQHPDYLTHLKSHIGPEEIETIRSDTKKELERSIQIGKKFFEDYSLLFDKKKYALSSGHAGRH